MKLQSWTFFDRGVHVAFSVLVALMLPGLSACVEDPDRKGPILVGCTPGEEDCSCIVGDLCTVGLVCAANRCVSGSSVCAPGRDQCPCREGEMCDLGLVCSGGLCGTSDEELGDAGVDTSDDVGDDGG